jgi:hypothetical protein
MPRATKAPIDPDDAPLKRLGGGRWQTRDERFTIEPQSGTWVVVDAEQTDDLGMPLVRGPFRSLTEAKEGIASARSSGPASSPLADRLERTRNDQSSAKAGDDGGGRGRARASSPSKPATKPEEPAADDEPEAARSDADTDGDGEPRKARGTGVRRAGPEEPGSGSERDDDAPARKPKRQPRPDEPTEPAWLTDLDPVERGRARRLIARLEEDGHEDAVALVRRDVLGDVPAIAAFAIGRRLAALQSDASPTDVAELLADGRDERLDVRWRLVDGEGRPILIDARRRRGS